MAVSLNLTLKHKVFLLVLALTLALTILGRVSYSKHFHGLMCAARTYHEIAYSGGVDVQIAGSAEPDRDAEVRTDPHKQNGNIADKITEIRGRMRQQRLEEEKFALEHGIYDRKLMKKIKKQKKPLDESSGTQVLPQAIVIGVRKCGTRALLEMLEMHPQIAASGPEVHFFDKYYDRGLGWYRQQMRPSIPGQVTIEKTPSYFITESAPARIHSMNRDAKLLVIVRDPTTRVISDFTQIASRDVSKLTGERFEDMVIDSRGQVRTSYKAVQISMYSNHLSRWLEFFPRSQMLFVDGDKLVTDPVPEIKRVEAFLGIADYISSDKFQYNANTGFYCLTGELNSKCLAASKGREHPKVAADVIDKLQNFFRPYNEKFFKMTGRRFDWP